MKSLLPRIWEWSWFSEEKGLDFNGHLLAIGEHHILIDPPPMTPQDLAFTKQNGPIDYILVTNRDHERDTASLKKELDCSVMVPELDAPEMTIPVDKTYKDGELLPGGIWVIQLSDQKSRGESALFLQQGKGILLLGDALLGKPSGSLSMLPAEKYTDAAKAKEGLQRLLKYQFDSIIVGDGTSILTGGKPILEQAVAS